MGPRLATCPVLALTTVLLVAQSTGCRCGDRGTEVGRLVTLEAVTELAAGGHGFVETSPNTRIFIGDALRTNETGSATVEIAGQGQLRISPRSLVRFTELGDGADGARELRLLFETGALDVSSLEAEDAPLLLIDGPGGRVRVGRGSTARLVLDEAQRLRLDVEVGLAEAVRDGETTTVSAGGSAVLGEPPVELLVLDGGTETQGDAGSSEDLTALAEAGGVTVRLERGAAIEVQGPGEQTASRPRGREVTVAPGSIVRLSGRGGAVVVGPAGAEIALQPGARALVQGMTAERLAITLQGGSAEARASGPGVAALSLPGGQAATARLGAAARFLATTLGPDSSRINVRSGAAFVRSGERMDRALTGTEVLLGPDGRLAVSGRREVPPVLQGSAVLHDPQARGSFTIRFPPVAGCSAYVVEVSRGGRTHLEAITGTPTLPITDAEYGDYQWRAACLTDGAPSWSDERGGRISRRPDRSGQVQMPTKAPRTTLDSDGRSYNVLYQNRLPAFTLRWSEAPPAPRYALEVFNDSTGRRVHNGTSARAAHSFASGVFPEGSYYWFFRAEGGAERAASPVTRARVSFDNVAPAIQILEPRQGAPASGSVRVRGIAAVGSTVVANGVTLDLGSDFRFDQVVPVAAGDLVLFRVSTPRRGVGYYLRHLSR